MESDVWATASLLPLVTRALERLLIVFGGILGIYFGYRLFSNGVIVDQTAGGEFKAFKISLGKVGPGVFFALFGTGLLSFSLASPITISPDTTMSISLASQPSHEQQRDIIRTLNALQGLKNDPEFDLPKFYPATSFEKAIEVLEGNRDRFLVNLFGTDQYEHYLNQRDRYMTSPESFKTQERERLREVHEIYESRFEQ